MNITMSINVCHHIGIQIGIISKLSKLYTAGWISVQSLLKFYYCFCANTLQCMCVHVCMEIHLKIITSVITFVQNAMCNLSKYIFVSYIASMNSDY